MEKSCCPLCQEACKVIGSRKRQGIREDGEPLTLVVRRLRCQNPQCRKIHHELPDFLMPFKRHMTETLEKVLQETTEDVPMEDTTIRRIRQWFAQRADALVGGLLSAYVAATEDFGVDLSTLPQAILPRICFFVGSSAGWLKKVVQILVQTNRWPQTQLVSVSTIPFR